MGWIEYKYQARPYQRAVHQAFDNGCKRIVQVWHRRSGKDLTDLNIVIEQMLSKIGNYYYFFPTYAQVKKVIWEGKTRDGIPFLDYFPKDLIRNKNDTELKVVFKNGSIFQLIGTDKFDHVLGTNPIGTVWAEYSLQNPKAWDYFRPILAENEGWAIFNFTPRGQNHGWKLLQLAKQSDKWFWQVLTVDDTKSINQEVLDQEKLEMPSDLYKQEYYCEFLEDAGAVFKGIERCIWDKAKLRESEYNRLKWAKEKSYQLGIDLAKYNDFTVITPFDLNLFVALEPDRFNLIDYNLQKARIETAYYKYNKAKAWIDSTGVGEPIFDDLADRGLHNLNPYTFTERSRRDLLTNLQILLEQNLIKIPNYPQLLNELKGFHYELTDTGRVKMAVPEGLHDDCVMSLALAVWDIDKPVTIKAIEDRAILKQFDYYTQRKQLTGSRYLYGRRQ